MQKEEITTKHEKAPKKAAVKIAGMTCTSCAQSIEKALTKTKGVSIASVNFATETAYVEYDDAITSEKEFEKVIKDIGYDVYKGTKKIILRIGDM
ncbi:MAG: heavy metal-associated domain-containing protein, partial [Candidatus Bathyarchaeia archaeon]